MPDRVLVLAPHTDDGEFGCGGAIARFVEEGKEVHYVAFSTCERSVPAGFPPDALEKEMWEATAALGIPADRVQVKRHEVREFPAARQEILEELIVLRGQVDPDLVLLPAGADLHQDHGVVHQEGVRAFKDRWLLGYEQPWNTLSFAATCVMEITAAQMERKMEAIRRYRSQQARAYADPEFIRGLARVRGIQIGVEFAEGFEVLRLPWRVAGGGVR